MTILDDEDPGAVRRRDLLGGLLQPASCRNALMYPHAFTTSGTGAH